jgi:hypothetical protein
MVRIEVFDAQTGVKLFDCLATPEEIRTFMPDADAGLPFLPEAFEAIRKEYPGARRGFLTVSEDGATREIWWEVKALKGKARRSLSPGGWRGSLEARIQ